ncbi:MAG TPA: peptidoglycan DD-metalloendopeptidase family protein [Longimicrobiaceae bacterium]|nr:peptidoglycan DD-metalloendopeptidase family protein [Longimicrobiaceae bacterium]
MKLRRRALALGLLVPGLLLCARPAAAQQSPDVQIRESQKRLEQIRREREQLRQQMDEMRSRAHSITSELQNLGAQVSASADALQELDFQLGKRQAEIEQTEHSLAETRQRLSDSKATLDRRLRDIYERGPLHTVQVLLTAESFGDLINRYKYLYLIARHDRELVREVATLQDELSGRERVLQHRVQELKELQGEKATEYARLEDLQAEQKRALAGVQQRTQAAQRRIAQLARDEREVSSLIATLERKRKEAEAAAARAARAAGGRTAASAPASSSITTSDLGNLAWPVSGRLLYRFGRDTQPNGTVLRWNGIGIGAAAGSDVRAVESGTVVKAGPLEGYGPSVVVSHGGGYYSLYLYLRSIAVHEGDPVKKNQVIGTVGGEGTVEGPHIEFQIRQPGGAAVDPLAWLRQAASR